MTFDLGMFLAENSQNMTKSNRNFSEKFRRGRALILLYLYGPMDKFFP